MAIQVEPPFAVTLRGYDRDEVDAHIEALRHLQAETATALEDAQDQVREIDSVVRRLLDRVGELEGCLRNETPRTIGALGERVTLLLLEAEAGASDALAEARAEADALVAEARRQADDYRQQVEVWAQAAVAETHADHAQLIGELNERWLIRQGELDALTRRRDDVRASLSELSDALRQTVEEASWTVRE